uniref:Uncharacterized protein n=1 Tax=Knipowitschia caucasica TaxID=637954 RepID=A0AAV2KN64_KNICA
MNYTIIEYFQTCFLLPNINYQAIAFNLINVPFIFPVCVYILCLGLQRYRSRAQISHTDFFTYNMALIQLIGILGSCLLTGNMTFMNSTITVTGPGEGARNSQSKQKTLNMILVITGALLVKFGGEGGGVSRSKQRAFNTIMIIFLALQLWLGESIMRKVLNTTNVLNDFGMCVLYQITCWFEAPSSLVLPLLFLHRAGILPKCRFRKNIGVKSVNE